MTENESTYTGFCSKINKFFQNFASKSIYWKFLCVIMNGMDGQTAICAVRYFVKYTRIEHEEEVTLWQQSGFICSAKATQQ